MSEVEAAPKAPSHGSDGRIRCGVYARYSSDNQRKSSIEDQVRNAKETADRKGWNLLEEYIFTDSEKTGTTIHGRTGLKQLMDLAKTKPRPFDYIIVDDTSRFGRNKADTFKNVDILTFYGVNLYFVEDALDSAEPWFEQAFHHKAYRDEEFSKSHGHKIKRGRRGRFLNGYHPGGYCYGYNNVPDEDLTRKGCYGRPAVNGVYQSIDPEEAAIIVRVYEAYAAGMSLRDIAAMLNSEAVRPPQASRRGGRASWCKTAIREMLKNKRYIGQTTWGRTKQVRDPETGKLVRRDVPESEWDRREMPELRIISDELFARVQEQLKRATRGFGVKRLGGMTRTEASRRYLFSGLLKCGACGANMTIVTNAPARYGCADHRNRSTCANRTTIRLEDLEREFIGALAANLQSEALREELVKTLLDYLKTKKAVTESNQAVGDQNREQMRATRKTLDTQLQNVMSAIRDCGYSRTLLTELTELEAKAARIDEILAAHAPQPEREITEKEVREFLTCGVESFAEVLTGTPEVVRQHLQKSISSITLTPSVDERGSHYKVSGDVALFSAPQGAVQNNPVELVALHYKIPITIEVLPSQGRGKKLEAVAA